MGDTSVVTATPDIAGSHAGTFFRVYGAQTGTQYYFWFKVSGSGTDPANAGETGIEVDIATGATAAAVATAVYNAAIAVTGITTDFTVSKGTTTVTFVSVAPGCVNAHDGLSMYATGFTFSNTSYPVLNVAKSKGVLSFVRTGTGLYTVTFGVGAPTSVTDLYPRLFTVDYQAYNATAPAAPYLYVVSQAVSASGTIHLKFLAANGTTAADPACGEELWLEFMLKNTTAQ